MIDVSESLSEIRGVAQMLWVLSGFENTDLQSMSDAMYNLSRDLDHAIKTIEEQVKSENKESKASSPCPLSEPAVLVQNE